VPLLRFARSFAFELFFFLIAVARRFAFALAFFVIASTFVPTLVLATTKEDQAMLDQLTAQIARDQIELQAANKASTDNRAALQLSLAKIAEQNKQQAVVAERSELKATSDRSSQQADAATAAQSAQDSAVQAHSDQQQAHDSAADQLTSSRDQTKAFLQAADGAKWDAYKSFAIQAFGFLTVLAGILGTYLTGKENHRLSMGKIAEVKDEARAAYTEANNINLKIASVGLKMADGSLAHPEDAPLGVGAK
jgi:cobalamin biosynthesis Mg chelatase CobN